MFDSLRHYRQVGYGSTLDHSLRCITPMDVNVPTTNTDGVGGINVAQW